MKSLCKLFFLVFFASKLSAQTFLFFPESSPQDASHDDVNTCLKHSTEVLEGGRLLGSQALQALRHDAWRLQQLGERTLSRDLLESLFKKVEAEQGKDSEAYYQVLLDLARAQVLVIRYDLAIKLYEEAALLGKRKFGPKSKEVWLVEAELSQIHGQVRHYPEAFRMTLSLLETLKTQGLEQSLYYAITLNNLGILRQQQNYAEQAIVHYQQALKLFEQLGYSKRIQGLATLSNYAHALVLQKQGEQAQSLLQAAETDFQKLQNQRNFMSGRVLFHLAHVQGLLGNYRKAEAYYKTAVVSNSLSFNQIQDLGQEAETMLFDNQYIAICTQAGTMMSAAWTFDLEYRKTGNQRALKQAHEILRAMGKFENQMLKSFNSEADKLIFFQLGADAGLKKGLDLSYEAYRYDPNPSYIEEAFEYSERTKSTLLLSALQSRKNRSFGRISPELLKRENELIDQHRLWYKRYLEAPNPQSKTQARSKLNEVERQQQALQTQVQREYPDYFQHRYNPQVSGLKEVQSKIAPNSALLSFSLAEDIAHVFVITSQDVHLIRLAHNQAETELQVNRLRRALSDYEWVQKHEGMADSVLRQSARFFYKTYLEEALAKLDKKYTQLQIIPDGVLAHLPFEVFLSKDPEQPMAYRNYPFLIQDYTISYAYSATLLLENLRQGKERKPQEMGVLGMAASYNGELPSGPMAARRSGLDVLRQSLQPLPGALEEVALMKHYLFGTFLSGASATEATFKLEAPRYNILHLAMHGLLNKDEPLFSSLAFTEDGNDDEDNFLHAYEISQMELQANMVVLSACETGYGKFRQGEGVMSLAHAFMYAGAASVNVSLWQVNDASTGLIMEQFYRNLADKMGKDQALRQAKLSFLSEQHGLSAHPMFWAAFVQMGDASPIDLYCKVSVWLSYLGWAAGILGVLGLGFWFRKRKAQIA